MGSDDAMVEQLLLAIQSTSGDRNAAWATAPEPLTGGFWARLWRVRLRTDRPGLDRPLVARVMPKPDVAARETAVQAHLAEQGYPTPTVRLHGPPGPELDQAWMLMDLAHGQPLLDDLSGPSALARLPSIARSLPDRLAGHAASLHRVDPEPLTGLLDSVDLLASVGAWAADIGRTDLRAVADRLADSRPDGGRDVICHGDFHPFNILTGPDGDTVLDWSVTELADPASDVAYTGLLLRHPPLAAPGPVQPFVNLAGRLLAKRFRATYDRLAERPVDPGRLAWFTDVHALRVATEVAVWEANDELADHPDHPYLLLTPVVTARLRQRTGLDIRGLPAG